MLQAQQECLAEDWSACGLPEPLRVRMALHAGPVDPGPGGDYRSPVLNRLGGSSAWGMADRSSSPRTSWRCSSRGSPLAVARVGDRRGVALSHLNLGTLAHDLGDDDRALSLLTEGLKVFWELGDKRGIVRTLESIARAAPLAVIAARLQGAADALQESINLATPIADREHHDRAISRVRTALGDDAYNVAWSAGRALSWEDAVAEGLALARCP